MPVYEFECRACKKKFPVKMRMSERENAKFTCPHCKGDKVRQVLSIFSAMTSKKS